jgi:FG-GAP-like repeat
MRLRFWLAALALPVPLFAVLSALPAAAAVSADAITWKKTVLDPVFRSEGVAVADVNKDGKTDVINGEAWYEAPDWKMHPIRKLGDYGKGDGPYSHTFACWTEDLNGDGWPDLIVIDFPGAPCYWLENPKGAEGDWKQHEIWHSACNETPQYLDLFGDGKRELVMGFQPKGKENEGQMAWFTPGKDPTQTWEMHPISEPSAPGKPVPGTFRFAHGLGAGDVNGDGRADVICTGGWWEQPADAKTTDKAWKFHPADLGPDCSDMFAYDMDGDGKADILSASAHNYGIWSHIQKASAGDPSFLKVDLFPHLFSQTHAMHFVDINGDGLKDLVTGKRWWAHGSHGDADPNLPAVIYWFEAKKQDGVTTFTPHLIDDDSGVATQFAVADVNGDGLLDIVVSNKKGTCIIEQVRAKK